MNHNLSLNISTQRVLGSVVAGQDACHCQEVDSYGFEGVRFVALLGATAENGKTSLKVLESDISGNYGADVGGKEVTCTLHVAPGSDDGKLLIADVHRPSKRYLRAVVMRGDADAVVDGLLAERYRGLAMPVDVHSSVARQVIVKGDS